MENIQPKDITRFLSKIKVAKSGCWEWTAFSYKNGYGEFSFQAKPWYAHRFSYELFYHDLDDSLTIDHLCRNRKCVNPEHLEQVTRKENVLRGIGLTAKNSKKTHCINGHEFTIENTYIRRRKIGGRVCKICQNKSSLKYQHNKRRSS